MSPMEKKPEPSDMEIVLEISEHIAKPCEDGEGHNIRDFYLREAQRYLDKNIIKQPKAREALEAIIKIYSRKR